MTDEQRNRLVVLLAVVSGATDATGFLALGGAFTSVMTGNLVLVGVAAGSGDASAIGLTLAAIFGYVVGAAAGTRLAGAPQSGDGTWPAAVSRALAVELGLFAGFAAAWWALGEQPSAWWGGVLLTMTAAALGLQSSAILRFGVPGLSTTYLTGTLTTMVSRVASREPLRTVRHAALLLAALIAGAATGAALVSHARVIAPLPQLVLLTTVLVVARRTGRVRQVVR